MSLFRELDLYKVIILLSMLLLPASLGYVYWVEGELDTARAAVRAAEHPNGELKKIGEVCQRLDTVQRNTQRGSASETHRLYFDRIILGTATAGIESGDFQIGNERTSPVRRGERATDIEVPIEFGEGRQRKVLPRDFIHAMLLNCEQGGTQVWKLRQLDIQNVEAREFGGRGSKAPPKTIKDEWEIRELVFARREPERR